MSDFVGVGVSVDDGVATVTLSNPSAGNALTRHIFQELVRTWERIEADPAIKVAIFTAAGEKFFCTGADVSALKSQGSLRLPGEATGEAWRLTWKMAGVTKPVLVVVNGIAAGGGLGFVTDGDIVYASRAARFVDTHVHVGQICGYGALRLVSIIGASEAKRVAIAGGSLSAERARELGLINELFDTADEAMEAALTAARKIASASPTALRVTFGLLEALAKAEHERSVVRLADAAIDRHMPHPDATEGAKAWLEKRSPAWAEDAGAHV